ncbi:MAG: sugar phosphate isomerase/epimerase family protein [Pirellulaceae bacterium]
MNNNLSRRQVLASVALVATGVASSGSDTARCGEPDASESSKIKIQAAAKEVKYCLNMSTIRGQKLPLPQQVDVASKAGYQAIEPWMGELDEFVKSGGKLADLRKQIEDAGLTVESAIGFAQWIVDDDEKRKAGLEQAKRDMDTLRQIGGKRIAAPPTGATNQTDLNLLKAADRYRALLELGDTMEVTPQVEVWGFSTSLSRLGETMQVALEARHPKACVLPDVYHLYKGGSEFHGLRMLSGQAVQVFHMNDYPKDPPRTSIKDADRVYPGDGVAPLGEILRTLFSNGFRGVLSLELFNPEYWKQDALAVAKQGLEKMKESVAKAVG